MKLELSVYVWQYLHNNYADSEDTTVSELKPFNAILTVADKPGSLWMALTVFEVKQTINIYDIIIITILLSLAFY